MRHDAITLALDARTIHRPIRRGTGKNLLDLYRTVLSRRPNWRVLAYHRAEAGETSADPKMPANYLPRRIEMRGDRFDAWRQFRLPLAAWRDGADLLHCPANTRPTVFSPLPTLLTVHDLLPLERDRSSAERFARSVRFTVRRGEPIITPSEYTAWQLVSAFDADRQQITVNHWAADNGTHHVTDSLRLNDVRGRYHVPGRFALHLGAAAPRKNTLRTLEAWSRLPRTLRLRWTLLVVGLDDAEFRATVEQRIGQFGIGASVRCAGFADESEMPALLSAAEALVYPSLSEGFGLPILDAWATRTPVLTSRRTSLPEVAEHAACYVDPEDPASIADGLKTLLNDAALRRTMIERGLERGARFTWDATAERFIDAVESAVEHQPARRRHEAA